MTIALAPPAGNLETLELKFNISTTLGISAVQARRKLTRYFMDHVSMFIGPETPLLVIVDPQTIRWRFPITFSQGQLGNLGIVGQIDVDAFTGELLLDRAIIQEILANAHRLAQGAAHPSKI